MVDPTPQSILSQNANQTQNVAQQLGEAAQALSSAADKVVNAFDSLGERGASGIKKATSAIHELEKTARTEIPQASQQIGEFTKKTREASASVDDLVQNARKNPWAIIADGIKRAGDAAASLDDKMTKLRRSASEVYGAFGAGNLRDRIFGNLTDSTSAFSKYSDALHEIAISGKLTRDEVAGAFAQMAERGVDFNRTLETLSGKGLSLINQGILDLGEVTNLTAVALNELGASTKQTEQMLLGISMSVGKLNEQFNKSVLSSHQLAREVLNLQQSFRFVGTDVSRMPQQIMAFAEAAERFRAATGRGMTGAVAAQVGGQMLGNIAKMSPEQRIFFGQMAGMGSGALAGENVRTMMQGEGGGGRVAAMALRVLQQQGMGGEFLTGEQVQSAQARGDIGAAQRMAEQRLMQGQMLQQFMGVGQEEAFSLLDAMGGGNFDELEKTLKEAQASEKQLLATQNKILEDNKNVATIHLQTTNELLEEVKSWAMTKAFGSEGGSYIVKALSTSGWIVRHLQYILGAIGAQALFGRTLSNLGPGGLWDRFKAGRTPGPGAPRPINPLTGVPDPLPEGAPHGGPSRARRWGGRAAGIAGTALFLDSVTGGHGMNWIGDQLGLSEEGKGLTGLGVQGGLAAWQIAQSGATAMPGASRLARAGTKLGFEGGDLAMKAGVMSGKFAAKKLPLIGALASGAFDVYDMYQGFANDRMPEYLSDNLALQMLEGGGGDALDILMSGGLAAPIKAVKNLSLGGKGVYDTFSTYGDVRDATRAGAARTGRQFGAGASTDFNAWQAQNANLIGEAGASNVPWFFSGGPKGISETYGDASKEQQRALTEGFNRFLDAYENQNYKDAQAYLMMVRQAAPDQQKTDDVIQEMLRIVSRQSSVTYEALQESLSKQREEKRNQEKAEKVKEERESRKPIVVHLAGIDLNLDAEKIARITGQWAVNSGQVAPGQAYVQPR